MAIMFNCATDWSFDLALADARKATALPMAHGVYRSVESEGEALFTYLKTSARKFAEEFKSRNDGHTYSPVEGYVGDAWINSGALDLVSDWYKDSYNQRPHFEKRVFAMLCGLSTSVDTIYSWGHRNGIEGYLESLAETAKAVREAMDRAWAEEYGA